MRLRVMVLFGMALALAVGSASAQQSSIGIFWDTGGATCSTTQANFTPGAAYVIGLLGPDAIADGLPGITGAEMSVSGIPSGWFPSVTPHSGTQLGNILGTGGNIAFVCDPGSGGKVLLYTINYFATSVVSNLYVSVLQSFPPSNPN